MVSELPSITLASILEEKNYIICVKEQNNLK
jgi:hypothetical protein